MVGLLVAPAMLGFADGARAARENDREREVRVAMCQTLCVDGDREGNFDRIEEALKQAKEGHAQIACFPETAILGWVNPEAHERAFPIPGRDTERLADLAKRYRTMICVGLAEKDGALLYDSVVLIDSRGRLLLKHRKINILTELMDPPYTRGKAIEAIDTEFGRIGLLVCADTFVKKNVETMKTREPDFILVPYGWAAKPEDWPGHGESLRDRVSKTARTIGAPVVGTDLVGKITHGPWKGRTYGGQSVTCGADGKVLARCKDRKSDLVFVDIRIGRRGGGHRPQP